MRSKLAWLLFLVFALLASGLPQSLHQRMHDWEDACQDAAAISKHAGNTTFGNPHSVPSDLRVMSGISHFPEVLDFPQLMTQP